MVYLKRMAGLLPSLLLALSLFALTACAPQAGPQPSASAPAAAASTQAPGGPPAQVATQPGNALANTSWSLISMGAPGSETMVVSGTTLTLAFGTVGQVTGNGGCNSFGATFQQKGEALTFGQVNSTMKACADNNVMQQEQQYFQALQKASTFTMKGDRMLIFYNGGQGVMNFVQAKGQT